MRESGIITEIEEHTMMVEFERSSMCEKCGASRENNRERQDENHGKEIGQHEL